MSDDTSAQPTVAPPTETASVADSSAPDSAAPAPATKASEPAESAAAAADTTETEIMKSQEGTVLSRGPVLAASTFAALPTGSFASTSMH